MPMGIRLALDTLLEALDHADAPLRAQFADGLSDRELDDALTHVAISLAAEVRDYFAWRNGLRRDRAADYELFPDAVPLSLDEAVAEYRQHIEVATTIARQASISPASLWNPRWFPLFRGAGGDYHVTWAGDGAAPTAPISFVALEDREPKLAYDSLTSLVETVTACVAAGAFTMAGDGAVHEDRSRTGEIVRRFNPGMVDQATRGRR